MYPTREIRLRLIDRCLAFANAELDEYITRRRITKPRIDSVESRTKYDCIRELYDIYSMDCFPEPSELDRSYIIIPNGGMLYITIGTVRQLLLAIDIQSDMNTIKDSIIDANTLCLCYNIIPYVIFASSHRRFHTNYRLSAHYVSNTEYMRTDEVEDQISTVIDNINIAKTDDNSAATICVNLDALWTETEMLRICKQIIRRALERLIFLE